MLFFAILFYIFAWVFLLYTIASFFIFKGWKYPPYLPSLGKVKRTLLQETEKVLENSQKKLVVADFGCGDGCLLARLARRFPNHHFVGYEWNPLPFCLAKFRLRKYPNVHVIKADLMQEDISHIDVVMCYWPSEEGYARKLKHSLKKSAIVLSEIFEIKGWKVYKKVTSRMFGFKTAVFIYHMQNQKDLKSIRK